MKLPATLLVATLLSAALVVAPWVVMFDGPFTSNPSDWASFGAYFGGVLSPLIAAFALVAFLRTLHQQQAQIDQLHQQSTKEDLWRIIEKIERDFEAVLRRHPIKVIHGDRIYEYSGLDVVFNVTFTEYANVMCNQSDITELLEQQTSIRRDDPKIHAFEMFALAAGHLNQLRLYLASYADIAGNNAMSKYFRRKYKVPYERFIQRGYLHQAWHEEC